MRPDMLGSATGGGIVLIAETPHGITEISEQMPSVGHLNSIRCALANAIGISTSTITGDDLNAGTIAQPCGECRRFAVRQEIDDLIRLQVHQYRAVAVPASPCPIVHSENTRHGP